VVFLHRQSPARVLRVRKLPIVSSMVTLTLLSSSISLASSALADPSENLKSAVASARAGSSCGPLRYNPVVEQAAEITNQSTDKYVDHATSVFPDDDPLPGLKDLGYSGSKGTLLRGAAMNEADSIKGAILEGFDKLLDCSYKDFGVSMLRNHLRGYFLSSYVLAGP
jgi:hypothetical protein